MHLLFDLDGTLTFGATASENRVVRDASERALLVRNDASVTRFLQSFQRAADGIDSERSGKGRAFVKKEDAAGAQPTKNPCCDRVGVAAGQFEAPRTPAHALQTPFRKRGGEPEVFNSHW